MRVDALWIHPGCAHDASTRPKVGEKSRSLRCRLATWVLVPRLPCCLDASRSNAKDAGVIVPARLTTDPDCGTPGNHEKLPDLAKVGRSSCGRSGPGCGIRSWFLASIAFACNAERSFLRWPGMSSLSRRCSRWTIWTRRWASSPTAVGEHPQGLELTVGGQYPQPLGADRDDRDRVSIQRVGLAVVSGIKEPDPGGELGRDIHDMLTGLQEPLGQRPACTVCALDRPEVLRPRLHVGAHRCVSDLVGGEPA